MKDDIIHVDQAAFLPALKDGVSCRGRMKTKLQNSLEKIKSLDKVEISTSLFKLIVDYFINTESDVTELIDVCEKHDIRYLPPLIENSKYFNILYESPAGIMGIHTAMQSNSG